MKVSSSWLLLISVVCLFFSCGKERYPERLVMADSLASVKPDSARQILARMAKDTADMPTSHKMYYKLLVLKADDKSYIERKSASAAMQLVDYYQHKEDPRLLAEAYYYAGSAYRDMNDAPQALEYFQKVIEVLPEEGFWRMKSYTYNQMGKLFLFQGLNNIALTNFQRSYQIDSIRKDCADIITSLRDLSVCYENMGDFNKCMTCLKKAEKHNQTENLGLEKEIDHRKSIIYMRMERWDSAWKYIQLPLKKLDRQDVSATYSAAAEIYYKLGKLDSASVFCKELLDRGNIYAKPIAAKLLAHISLKHNDPKNALEHIEKYDDYANDVAKIEAKNALVRANSLYNYSLREQENAKLKSEKMHILIICIVAAFVLLLVISILIIINVRSKITLQAQRLKIHMLSEMEMKLKLQNKEIHQNRQMEVEMFNRTIEEKDKMKDELERQLLEQKKKLTNAIKNMPERLVCYEEQSMELMKSDTYSLVKKHLLDGKAINVKEWKFIEEDLRLVLGDFKYILNQAYELSAVDYRICILVKLGLKNNEISLLISRTPNAVSQARKRLYTKITGEDGSASDFDRIIKSL